MRGFLFHHLAAYDAEYIQLLVLGSASFVGCYSSWHSSAYSVPSCGVYIMVMGDKQQLVKVIVYLATR